MGPNFFFPHQLQCLPLSRNPLPSSPPPPSSTESSSRSRLMTTRVCPTEIIAFSERVEEFKAIGCEVVAASVDSEFSHLAWVNTPRKQGGLGEMKIPIIADITKKISSDYGVLLEDEGIALRGLFIINPEGVVEQVTVNNLPVGRSVDETLRLVKAFQFVAENGEVCPAGWSEGSATIVPEVGASKNYFENAN